MVGWVAQPGLRQAGRWHVAARTIGNDHSTLIGLLIDWWTSMDPEHHWALEGGPGNGLPEGGGRGQRDALFCRGLAPIGVLEVEGYRYAIEKIGSFFEAHYPELKPLEFGLLLLYNYEPKGPWISHQSTRPSSWRMLPFISSPLAAGSPSPKSALKTWLLHYSLPFLLAQAVCEPILSDRSSQIHF